MSAFALRCGDGWLRQQGFVCGNSNPAVQKTRVDERSCFDHLVQILTRFAPVLFARCRAATVAVVANPSFARGQLNQLVRNFVAPSAKRGLVLLIVAVVHTLFDKR